ncbi:MAG: hypothetical protein E6H03_01675 [Bacillati bacterium ANGP1]|uniref:Antitoxin FitA-like ribbon-helix-helix domain-containing protein n=1 Tax=Candidatus Segetimicrobium genomatis TaxID=2569760 RepID=A0A537JM99_9BACT|nr:MAG: hypothetical protein E6H03_01675 [Terrabacteria group bacterium ANGP1]
MADLVVRDVPEHVVRSLKRRAARRRRSLQQELVSILESAAEEPVGLPDAFSAIALALSAKIGSAEPGGKTGKNPCLARLSHKIALLLPPATVLPCHHED